MMVQHGPMVGVAADQRFLIRYLGEPVACRDTVTEVIAYLWGRDVRWYDVLDYEQPIPVDTPDLLAWAARNWPGEA